MELIGSGLGDNIDIAAQEITVRHIKGRHIDIDTGNRVY